MPRHELAAALIALGLVLAISASYADEVDAHCVLRKDGETKEGASGPCSFSQRQGYVDIDLRNGVTYSLTPGNEAHHYRDQEGKKVVRTVKGDGSHEYKWEGKKIIVTFPASRTHSEPAHSGWQQGPGRAGDVPHDLRDLPGGRYVGGEVDDEMVNRGYRHVRNEQSAGELWSFWSSGGRCVRVHMDQNRRVSSAVNVPSGDCQ